MFFNDFQLLIEFSNLFFFTFMTVYSLCVETYGYCVFQFPLKVEVTVIFFYDRISGFYFKRDY
jgi:hypothetical protein